MLTDAISGIKNFLLDLIFPRLCLGCDKELNLKQTSLICEVCFNNIVLSNIQCHVCGLRNNFGVCKKCRRKTNLRGLFFAGQYQNPVLREMLHKFKYQSVESLKNPLAKLLINYLIKENLLEKFRTLILVPIPLAWRRKLSRGFNQSELLAKEISLILNCPVINLLKRQKFNAPQAKISDWSKRKENISGAFAINIHNLSTFYPISEIGYKKIVLVDDVATSGATLEEAAGVLKKAGIKEIYGLVIAKG